jgi:hypothetical protein
MKQVSYSRNRKKKSRKELAVARKCSKTLLDPLGKGGKLEGGSGITSSGPTVVEFES